MKLVNCHVENFGKLHDFDVDFRNGLNEIVEKNGYGKTTLATFLRVMFYGFLNEGKRNDIENERARYMPWQRGTYGGTIVFEAEGKMYELTRIFGAKKSEDEFVLKDANTLQQSLDYSENLGEELFKLDIESFVKTVFFMQNDIDSKTNSAICMKTAHIQTDSFDMNRWGQADEYAKDELNRLSPRRKTGVLYRLKDEITSLKKELSNRELLKGAHDELEARINEKENDIRYEKSIISNNQERLRELIASNDRKSKRAAYNSLKKECDEAIEEYETILEKALYDSQANIDINQMIEDYETLLNTEKELSEVKLKPQEEERYNYLIGQQSGAKGSIVVLIIGIILIIAGLVLVRINQVYAFVGLGAGIIFTTLFFIIKNKKKGKYTEEASSYEERIEKAKDIEEQNSFLRNNLEKAFKICGLSWENPMQQLIDLKCALTNEKMAEQKAILCKKKLQQFIEQNDEASFSEIGIEEECSTEELQNSIIYHQDRAEKQSESLKIYRKQLNDIEEQLEAIDNTECLLEEKEQEYQKIMRNYHILEKARTYLANAYDSLNARYKEPVLRDYKYFYEALTGDDAGSFRMDSGLNPLMRVGARDIEKEYLSAGYSDMVDIAMRFSLIKAMYKGEKPFIIIDDLFSNLDEDNKKRAKNLLDELSKTYQILCFEKA